MFSSLPYSMLVWPLPPHYLPPPAIVVPDPARSALPAPGAYRIDPDASSVGFAVRGLAGPTRGRFTAVTGSFRIGGPFEDACMSLDVVAASVRTGSPERDDDLLGPRFLDAATHPVLRFAGTRLGADLGAWTLGGRLTVRGTSRPVALRLDPVRRATGGAVVLRAPSPRWTGGTSGSTCRGCSSGGGCGSRSRSRPDRSGDPFAYASGSTSRARSLR